MSNAPLNFISQRVGSLAQFASDTVTSPFQEPSLKLGVTGLSRAGKTVFITSLIHNLLIAGRLPLFSPVAQGRLTGCMIQRQPNLDLPRFAYEANIDGLTNTDPRWPEGTWRLSQLRLALSYKPNAFLKRLTSEKAVLNVDIIDYPGEWLLDLPLLDLNFADWSAMVFEAARQPARSALAQDWLSFVAQIDLTAQQDERAYIEVAKRYTQYLKACRQSDSLLALLQPGRFLMPGDLEGSPALTFSPLPKPSDSLKAQSFYKDCEQRFESYKRAVVRPFFKNHFSRLDRQIVLTDLLGAAAAGSRGVGELQSALSTVLHAFRPGRNSWLSNLFEGRRIDKILFAATKADHLPRSQHEKLAALLRDLTFEPANNARFKGADIDFMTLAAIKATNVAQIKDGRKLYDCITGIIEGQAEPQAYYPGELPGSLQALKQGIDAPVAQARFMPPPRLGADGKGLPHIRLDRALDFLLGDLLT